MSETQELFELWKGFNKSKWKRYEGNAENERLVLEGASQYRLCLTAFDRSLFDCQNELVRTDNKTDEDDERERAERAKARAAELDASVTVSREDLEMFGQLSRRELFEMCKRDPDIARKYRKACRDFGYRPFNSDVTEV
jgi:hypothetical protein